MPTLLIGWELGGGGGHIHRLIPIIGRYLDQGWRVVAALRLRQAAQSLLARDFFSSLDNGNLVVTQAPIFLHRSPGQINAASLAEIFAHIGFAEADLWSPVVCSWERLIRVYQPDAIISDMAPSLNLAASGRVPVTVIGNGWTIPPAADEPTIFQSQRNAANAATAASLRVVETAFKVSQGRHSSGRFNDLLRGKANFVCTLKAFDPYANLRQELYFWPFEIPVANNGSRPRTRGFVYLPEKHPVLSVVVDVLSAGTLEFDGYFEGAVISSPNLKTARNPLSLSKVLPEASIAIHHGGLGTAIQCLIHHVPQLICPLDTEKLIIGQGIEILGVGHILSATLARPRLESLLKKTIDTAIENVSFFNMATLNPTDSIDALYQETISRGAGSDA